MSSHQCCDCFSDRPSALVYDHLGRRIGIRLRNGDVDLIQKDDSRGGRYVKSEE